MNGKYRILDFWAPWCAPCKYTGSLLDKVSEETGVEVVKINIDEDEVSAQQYSITNLPSVFILEDDMVIEEFRGGRITKNDILKVLNGDN